MKIKITFFLIMQLLLAGSATMSQSWQLQNSGTTQNLNSINFLDAQNGFCVGSGGTVLSTTNAGASWNPLALGTAVDFNGVCVIHNNSRSQGDTMDVFMCGADGIIYHGNGELVFIAQNSTVTTALNDIKFLDNAPNGVAVGGNGTVIVTGNNGADWIKLTNVPTNVTFTKVDMYSSTEWRIVGGNGVVLYTNNGGSTWMSAALPGSPSLSDIKHASSGQGWISGNSGELFQFNGSVYSPYTLYPPVGIRGLAFPSPDLGFGVGDNGYILNYNGTTWTPQQGPSSQLLRSVHTSEVIFDNAMAMVVHAWACGANGTIISTVQSFSKLEGNVTHGGIAIPNATVTVSVPGITPYTAITNAGGHYQIEPILGRTYTVTVTAAGFNTYSNTSVIVAPPATTTLNVILTCPVMTIIPPALTVNLMPGQMTDCTLTVQNTGDGLLQWGSIPWDILFNFICTSDAQSGVETDGQYIYTSSFRVDGSGNWFHKYALSGAWIEDFDIPGATAIRDLAFDGQYFYGGANGSSIYKMDFTNKQLVGTINTGISAIRHIAYDPQYDGFWVGGWNNLALVNRAGVVINTGSTGLTSMNGSAYDAWSAGGPYLWLFNQGGNKVDIWQYSITEGTLTGVKHDASDIPGYFGGIFGSSAGGLCISTQVVPGKIALVGSMQQININNTLFCYNLGGSTAPWITHTPASGTLAAGTAQGITVHFDAAGMTAGTYTATLTFTSEPNVGTVDIPVNLILNTMPLTVTVTGTLTNLQTACYNAGQTINVAGNGTMFSVQSGGAVTMIAGQNIKYLPTTAIQAGGTLHGYIAPTGPFCLTPTLPEVPIAESAIRTTIEQSTFKIYPNPTTGKFILELAPETPVDRVTLDIYGMWGENVLTSVLSGARSHEFSLSNKPAGIYFIRVISGDKVETSEIIKH